MNRRDFLKSSAAGVALPALGRPAAQGAEQDRPNIVWIVAEDMSCHFGYNGETTITTPNVDKLAAEGVNFLNAYITCPVCSPGRSAMISGMYQTTIGAHNHRSSRGEVKYHLPKHVKLIPEYFREAGYYVCNGADPAMKNPGKTDYNFVYDNDLYDGANWSGRKPGQPFFAQVQLRGGKFRAAKVDHPVSPENVTLPPYYPEDPVILEDWARYLNAVQYVDKQVGIVMKRLEDEGIAGNTVVIFITDHGISHARGKQFCYEEGVHIPFLVWAPGRVKGGAVREDFVAHIDMAATSMYFAGIKIPDYLESRTLFGPDARPRDYVVSARDRCDETVDRIRSVRKGQYKYIRNFHPQRPYLQPCAYKDKKEILVALRKLHAEGELNRDQALIFAATRAPEELYDLDSDPHELHNLAESAAHQAMLVEMRGILEQWIRETDDKGQYPESEAMYDSDMKVYVDGMARRGGEQLAHAKVIEANIRLMKQWRAQGI